MPPRRLRNQFGSGYVTLDGNEEGFWKAAGRHVPFSYRWLGKSLSVEDVEASVSDSCDWQELKKRIRPGDRISPFVINENTTAMRRGFVVIRDGQPIGGIVVLVS